MVRLVCFGLYVSASNEPLRRYLFTVLKNRMATQSDGPNRPYKSVKECITKIYASEGYVGLLFCLRLV